MIGLAYSGVSEDILILVYSPMNLINYIKCLLVSDCPRTLSSLPKAKISLIIQHFLFYPPTPPPHTHTHIYAACTYPIQQSYLLCYDLIGNYTGFKIRPNIGVYGNSFTGGGGGAGVSCPNILSIAYPKIKLFCPNITCFPPIWQFSSIYDENEIVNNLRPEICSNS